MSSPLQPFSSLRERLPALSAHHAAVLQALLVTLLWSSSYVLIKIGLEDIPALTFAGLRYSLAAVCLLGLVAVRPERRAALAALDRRDWTLLAGLGLTLYAVTQGAQFVALVRLPAVTVSLMLNFTPVLVTLVGAGALAEHPTGRQWAGMLVAVAGALLYFHPAVFPASKVVGLAVMAVGVLANAGASVLGRYVNRGDGDALVVTTVSMAVGSAVLLGTGVAVQGLPAIGLQGWAIVAWLAVVNTAFAFTLWNHTLSTLTAMESSVVNNTMLVQIAVLGWVFLGETLTALDWLALGVVAVGTLVVQVARS